MNSYSIIISGQEELDENWQDERCPNFGFRYDQVEISECFQNDDGTYVATYTSLTVSEPTDFTYLICLTAEQSPTPWPLVNTVLRQTHSAEFDCIPLCMVYYNTRK